MTDPAMNDWDVVRARLTPKWATGTPYDSPATNALDRLQARTEALEAAVRDFWVYMDGAPIEAFVPPGEGGNP